MRNIFLLLFLSLCIIPHAYAAEANIRVKLSAPAEKVQHFSLPKGGTLTNGIRSIDLKEGTPFYVVQAKDVLFARVGNRILRGAALTISTKQVDEIIEVSDWQRKYSWDKSGKINDNTFQSTLTLYPEKEGILLINTLPLTLYMQGVAEVPESEPTEKRKAMTLITRSYATYYSDGTHHKFSDTRFDASDSPNEFQKYLGYGFSLRSPKWQEALKDTEGLLLLHEKEVLRAAYSSCSDASGKRKTPKEAGWKDPYFTLTADVYTDVPDPYGMDLTRAKKGQCGHGVGLSGLGATVLAQAGKTYEEILMYYYKNISIGKLEKTQ